MKGESESLQIEQEAKFEHFWTPKMEKTVENQVEGFVRAYLANNYDAEAMPERVQKGVRAEKEFVKKVIFACVRWSGESDQESIVVLWDIDETVGIFVEVSDDEESKFYLRPTATLLMEFINEQFPRFAQGILSSRARVEQQLQGQIPRVEAMAELAPFINTNHIYTSRGVSTASLEDELFTLSQELNKFHMGYVNDSIQKLVVLRGLKKRGVNAKLIDDFGIAGYLQHDGVQVNGCLPFGGTI